MEMEINITLSSLEYSLHATANNKCMVRGLMERTKFIHNAPKVTADFSSLSKHRELRF